MLTVPIVTSTICHLEADANVAPLVYPPSVPVYVNSPIFHDALAVADKILLY